MTKAYAAKVADGTRYQMTVTETTAPNGRPAVRLTCTCPTHTDGNAAIVATPSGLNFPKSRIHGHVTMANHPGLRSHLARTGKAWKA